MSDYVQLVSTTFIDNKDGAKSHGYRIFDDTGGTYGNGWDAPVVDDAEMLKKVASEHEDETTSNYLEYAYDEGIEVNGTFYSADEVELILAGINPLL
jgi:hypothetical protein